VTVRNTHRVNRTEFDALIATGSDEALLDAVWDYLPTSEDENGKFDGDAISVTQYAIAEICNGGFFQFYGNGIFDPVRLITKFEEILAFDLAEVVRKSMAIFPDGKPLVRRIGQDVINEELRELGISHDSFDEIDRQLFSLYKGVDAFWANYIRAHSERFWGYISS
jgi:hypothetical protein